MSDKDSESYEVISLPQITDNPLQIFSFTSGMIILTDKQRAMQIYDKLVPLSRTGEISQTKSPKC